MLLGERAWGESSSTRRGATLRQYSGMVCSPSLWQAPRNENKTYSRYL